jgi:RNA polymerase sigma-70 factor (ECF subfamily)
MPFDMTTKYAQPGRQARTTEAAPASCDSKTRKLARAVGQLHRGQSTCPQMGMQSAADIEYDTGVEDTDWRDIQASLAGDEESYERLVRRYESQIAAMMWRFSRRPDQCEELMQDVFVQAYFSLPGFRGDGPFVHWLKRIGTRVGYRFWKQQGRKNKPLPLGDIDPAAEELETMDPSMASQIVEALLSELKPSDRLVLTLQYFEGCSMKEIADRMGWNEAMVKMRAYRARNRLRAIARRRGLMEKLQWTN